MIIENVVHLENHWQLKYGFFGNYIGNLVIIRDKNSLVYKDPRIFNL